MVGHLSLEEQDAPRLLVEVRKTQEGLEPVQKSVTDLGQKRAAREEVQLVRETSDGGGGEAGKGPVRQTNYKVK